MFDPFSSIAANTLFDELAPAVLADSITSGYFLAMMASISASIFPVYSTEIFWSSSTTAVIIALSCAGKNSIGTNASIDSDTTNSPMVPKKVFLRLRTTQVKVFA